MHSLAAIAMPIALLLPLLGNTGVLTLDAGLLGSGSALIEGDPQDHGKAARQVILTAPQYPSDRPEVAPLDAFQDGQIADQIRIEQRVIVRISPRRSRNELVADLPQEEAQIRYEERKMDKCLPVSRIAGVQTGSGNRLLLFMRDAKIVSVNLEKACRARDFYSGFYVEKSEDGQLCVDRDKLQSRSGAKCEVERMRQLVAVED